MSGESEFITEWFVTVKKSQLDGKDAEIKQLRSDLEELKAENSRLHYEAVRYGSDAQILKSWGGRAWRENAELRDAAAAAAAEIEQLKLLLSRAVIYLNGPAFKGACDVSRLVREIEKATTKDSAT